MMDSDDKASKYPKKDIQKYFVDDLIECYKKQLKKLEFCSCIK